MSSFFSVSGHRPDIPRNNATKSLPRILTLWRYSSLGGLRIDINAEGAKIRSGAFDAHSDLSTVATGCGDMFGHELDHLEAVIEVILLCFVLVENLQDP